MIFFVDCRYGFSGCCLGMFRKRRCSDCIMISFYALFIFSFCNYMPLRPIEGYMAMNLGDCSS